MIFSINDALIMNTVRLSHVAQSASDFFAESVLLNIRIESYVPLA